MSRAMFEILDIVIRECRGWLPHEEGGAGQNFNSGNTKLSADTRTKLAFLEDYSERAYRQLQLEEASEHSLKKVTNSL